MRRWVLESLAGGLLFVLACYAGYIAGR
jgi:hypothetical protein